MTRKPLPWLTQAFGFSPLIFCSAEQYHVLRLLYRVVQWKGIRNYLILTDAGVYRTVPADSAPFLGVTGAWLAIPVAEFLTLVLTLGMHQTYFRKPGERNYLL